MLTLAMNLSNQSYMHDPDLQNYVQRKIKITDQEKVVQWIMFQKGNFIYYQLILTYFQP